MAFTSLGANDSGPTSRNTINTNFTTAQTNLDTKVEFSGTAPVDGDLTVFSGTTGNVVKKRVLTASQIVESDSNGQLTTAAKGTAYNKNFGTGATDIPAGNSVVLLTGDETVNGIKTFPSSPIVPIPVAGGEAANKTYVDAIVAAATRLDTVYTNVTVSNTATETALYSFSVPGGTLSTNRGVRLRLLLSLKKASTAASFALRFKYGSTTLITTQINDATTFSTAKKGWVEFVLLATGATGTQEGSVVFNLVPDNTPASTPVDSYSNVSVGTSSIDSTSSQTIAVTVQFGSASSSDEAIAYQATLQII